MSNCLRLTQPKVFAAFSLLLLLLVTPSSNAQATINVPADQATIQAGINAANSGDTVLVAPGTYPENINFGGRAARIRLQERLIRTPVEIFLRI